MSTERHTFHGRPTKGPTRRRRGVSAVPAGCAHQEARANLNEKGCRRKHFSDTSDRIQKPNIYLLYKVLWVCTLDSLVFKESKKANHRQGEQRNIEQKKQQLLTTTTGRKKQKANGINKQQSEGTIREETHPVLNGISAGEIQLIMD